MTRIMIVDDEPLVRASIRRTLKLKGHNVIEAGSALQALEVLHRGPPFDVIITDLFMPDLDGALFAAEVEHRFGSQQLLLITGAGSPSLALHRPIPILRKPFTARELLEAIDRLALR